MLVGGINAPKKLQCLCSDGKSRPQLLKGRDDLRQDAVMEQYFSLMNTLLCCDPKTSERKINIRTYKVVPLSMRSGILEWCENTVPIGVYLGSGSDKTGAHRKYRPADISPHKCRQISMVRIFCVYILNIYNTYILNITPNIQNNMISIIVENLRK